MTEEKKTELGTASDKDIEAVNKEIEAKDSERLEKLQAQLTETMNASISNMQTEYNTQIEALKKSIEEKDSVIDSYNKRFEDVNSKLEELKPRKGLAKVEDDNPYKQISSEEQVKNADSVEQKIDIKSQIDRIRNLRDVSIQEDRDASQIFIDSLK